MDDTPLHPWRVTATREVHRDRWIHVRADDCLTANGIAVAPYYVLEYPDSVHVLALAGDEVVLVQQYRHGLGAVTLELPGGLMDPGERDPLITAQRELLEETGFAADSFRLVGRLPQNPATHTSHMHVVLALGARQVGAPRPDATEDLRVRLVPVPDLVRQAFTLGELPALNTASLAVGLAAAGRLGAA